jgi:glycosyltransferase involved in cell wall biosynthesis
MSSRPLRVAALVSHPIQYQAPLFRALAREAAIELEVLYCSDAGCRSHRDDGFGVAVQWDVPLLDGYACQFPRNLSPRPNPSTALGVINPGLYSAIRKGRFDVVWVHGWSLASNWIGFTAAFCNRIPVLVRGETNGLAEPAGVKGALKRRLLGWLFRKVHGILAIGTHNARFYESYGVAADKIFHAPYTVDNERFQAQAGALLPQRASLRRLAGLPEDKPVILFCGKLQPYKRPMDLLAAYAMLPPELGASLVFVGDGPLRQELERFAGQYDLERVRFAGFRNQSELPGYYALADVLVLPSGFEQWGLVVNEAMCFGLPVIVSDRVGCARDLVRTGRNGYTFVAGDVPDLADRLARMLSRDDLRRFGAESRAVISGWGIPQTAGGILEAVQNVARYRVSGDIDEEIGRYCRA